MLRTEPYRLVDLDKDGDEVLVLSTDYNLKDQGKMIDASKSGLFEQVVIPEVIKYKYKKRSQFTFYKDENKFNKDYGTVLALDFLKMRRKNLRNM